MVEKNYNIKVCRRCRDILAPDYNGSNLVGSVVVEVITRLVETERTNDSIDETVDEVHGVVIEIDIGPGGAELEARQESGEIMCESDLGRRVSDWVTASHESNKARSAQIC